MAKPEPRIIIMLSIIILDIPVILTPLSGDIDPPIIGLVQRA